MKSRHSTVTKYGDFVNSQRGGMTVHRGRLFPQRGRGIGSVVGKAIARLIPKATTALGKIGKNSGFIGNLVAKRGVRQLKKTALAAAKSKMKDMVNKGIAKSLTVAEKKLNTKIDRSKVAKAQGLMRSLMCEKTKKKKKKGKQAGGRRRKIIKRRSTRRKTDRYG